MILRGLLAVVPPADVTIIGNVADDLEILGLRVSPDLDSVLYALAGLSDEERGWGRADETWNALATVSELSGDAWFKLGDRDIGLHLVRTQMLEAGYPLSAVTEALCRRWRPGVRLLPMTDDRVETHVAIADPDSPSGKRVIHFQEYWVRLRASVPAVCDSPGSIVTRHSLRHSNLPCGSVMPSHTFGHVAEVTPIPAPTRTLLTTSGRTGSDAAATTSSASRHRLTMNNARGTRSTSSTRSSSSIACCI